MLLRTPAPLLLSAGAIGACLLSWFVLPFHPAVALAACFMVSSALYAAFAFSLGKYELSPRLVFVLIAGAIVLRLCFLWTTPVGSDDFYRYIWDGRVQAAAINPYAHAPNDPALRSLHTEAIPARVNHPEFRTLYFPLSLWMFYLSYELSGEMIWGYKLMLLLAECATVLGLVLLLRARAIEAKYVLLYALCPLPMVQFAIDAHLDGLGLPFLVFGILLYYRKKPFASALLLGLSMSIKPVALVLLPVLFFRTERWKEKMLYIIIPLAAVLLPFLPYTSTAQPFDAILAFAKNWTFNGAVFEVINAFVANNQQSRLICAGILTAALLVLYAQKRMETHDMLYYAALLLFLCSPVVHPWYVNWLAVLVPLARRASGIAYLAMVSLAVYTSTLYILTGRWEQPALLLAVEYIPVIGLFALEMLRFARSRGKHAPEIRTV